MTIDDIARELNISKTTVSRAISGKGRIGKKTREKVLQYINENNYRPNAIAKGLAQSRTFNIGFVMPGDYNIVELSFFQKCMWGISSKASGKDYDVIISVVAENDISQLERLVDHHKVDGIILGRTLEKDMAIEYLKKTETPFVVVGSTEDKDVIQIDNDHLAGCSELTGMLLEKGIRKLALIGGIMSHIVNQNRLKGYQEAFVKKGIPIDSRLIYTGIDSREKIEEVVKELLEKEAECILCMDDAICIHVLNALKSENVKVPEEVKVASFYNSRILENNQPAITSLQFDVMKLGAVSCELLFRCIDKVEAANQTLLGYKLVISESTE